MVSATVERNITLDERAIAEFCRRHHIRKLSLFGSVLTDRFRPDSDVDVLVEFEPGKTPGFEFFRMADDLEAMLGRRVDLTTPNGLSKYIRDRVLSQAQTVYAAN